MIIGSRLDFLNFSKRERIARLSLLYEKHENFIKKNSKEMLLNYTEF